MAERYELTSQNGVWAVTSDPDNVDWMRTGLYSELSAAALRRWIEEDTNRDDEFRIAGSADILDGYEVLGRIM